MRLKITFVVPPQNSKPNIYSVLFSIINVISNFMKCFTRVTNIINYQNSFVCFSRKIVFPFWIISECCFDWFEGFFHPMGHHNARSKSAPTQSNNDIGVKLIQQNFLDKGSLHPFAFLSNHTIIFSSVPYTVYMIRVLLFPASAYHTFYLQELQIPLSSNPIE